MDEHGSVPPERSTLLPPPPPAPPPQGTGVLGESGSASAPPVEWWRKALGGLGWVLTFLAIYSTTELVLRLALEAVGVDTTVTGPTGGDEKNPPGQVLALLSALAVGALGTWLLRSWYRSGPAAASKGTFEAEAASAPGVASSSDVETVE